MRARRKGVVAAGHAESARAGARMLELGGTAVDAALAAKCASFVVEPLLTSPAGGGFATVKVPGAPTAVYDFFQDVPGREAPAAGRELHFFPVDVDFGPTTQVFHIGRAAAAPPANLAGLAALHADHGTLPLSEIVAPAVELAAGVELSAFQAFTVAILAPIVSASPESAAIYLPRGSALREGERLRNPELGESLARLGREGFDGPFARELERRLLEAFGPDRGGLIGAADLAAYRVRRRRPLAVGYRGRVLETNPPPSSGGLLVALGLAVLGDFEVPDPVLDAVAHASLLGELMEVTNLARAELVDGRLHDASLAERVLARARVEELSGELHRRLERTAGDPAPAGVPGAGSTTHVSVIDEDGCAIGITTSNGEGCGFMIPGTGIMMNNVLGEEDLNPRGFHRDPPGRRVASMMAPTIVRRGEEAELVLGSGGSNRLRSAILQATVQLVDLGRTPAEAVAAPRMHVEGGRWDVEAHALSDAARAALAERAAPSGHLECWETPSLFFGGVHAVSRSAEGELAGGADPRREGAVAVVE